ncbi:6-phosphogluconate dehydrogenase, decarboxylating, partial [Eschrichtius robustus]|nr:6-phosphogluconate dehydrogenase, decarboxylating [Eschrichtius robustus]
MVHNRIEYGDMQLICEAYHLMKNVLGVEHEEMAKAFEEWKRIGSGTVWGQKGTGKWTAILALEYGVPVTLIREVVFARCLSSLKDERIQASRKLKGPQKIQFEGDKESFLESIRKALYASKIITYDQGFMLLRQAATEFGWMLNYGGIALMWRGCCISRSVFLGKIKDAFDRNPGLPNLLLDDFFKSAVETARIPDSGQSVLVSRQAFPCSASPLLFPSVMDTDTRCCQPT